MPYTVRKFHRRGCPRYTNAEASCSCKAPSWQADVSTARRRLRRNFKTRAEALTWAQDMDAAAIHGQVVAAPSRMTVREAWSEFERAAGAGEVLNRNGRPFAASTLAGYRRTMGARVLPLIGHRQLAELTRADAQGLVDRLTARAAPATVRNTFCPLQTLYRWAARRDLVRVDPTREVELPRGRGRRERIAQPVEARELIAALPDDQRALWATAFYAGLRRGELRALSVDDLDLDGGVLHVRRSTCPQTREAKEPKTSAGARTVPLIGELRTLLREHLLRTGRRGDDLVFGQTPRSPFEPSTVRRRAHVAWGWRWVPGKRQRDGSMTAGTFEASRPDALQPIALHEARHTAASFLIAAGVTGKALTSYMGHSSTATTEDVYGHLLDGHEQVAGRQLEAFLAAAVGAE